MYFFYFNPSLEFEGDAIMVIRIGVVGFVHGLDFILKG